MRRSAAQLMRATADAAMRQTRTAAVLAPASVVAVADSLQFHDEELQAAHCRQTRVQHLRHLSSSAKSASAGAAGLHLLLTCAA